MADNRILASVVRKGAVRLLDAAIDKALPVDSGEAPPKRKGLLSGIAGSLVVRIAARSVPGAIVLGGALLAKRRYDRRHGSDRAKGKGGDKA